MRHARNRPADAGGRDVHADRLCRARPLWCRRRRSRRRRARAACAMARTSASSTSVGSPASSTKVTTSASARAPETARSFTVPLTASSPIEPPGKRSGLTTKLSVVMAMRGAVDLRRARRRRDGVRADDRTGAERTDLRPAGGWPCRRRRAPSRSAGRGTGLGPPCATRRRARSRRRRP